MNSITEHPLVRELKIWHIVDGMEWHNLTFYYSNGRVNTETFKMISVVGEWR